MNYRCDCSLSCDRLSNPILYNILSQMDNRKSNENYHSVPHRCNCETRRTIGLKRPSEICKEASAVLVKTIHFMKNLPAFNQLPPNDQYLLLKNCWAPLFILGLAQEHVDFDVMDMPADSMLKKILLNREQGTDTVNREQPTMAGVSKLKSCLKRFWGLDLSPKEYAYLKGTTIFNPDVPDLKAGLFVEGLQQEAHYALSEVVQLLHTGDRGRFAQILLTASTLQSITPTLLTELFFRPVLGPTELLDIMVDMLF
uniref:Nuclear receptor subfamily 0, group B, member 2a n=1 Tax=Neogobius melanostomus TaxID=47308 RepID=A0A8C6SYS0_9GOBI